MSGNEIEKIEEKMDLGACKDQLLVDLKQEIYFIGLIERVD